MADPYPYSELQVFVAGLERGRRFIDERGPYGGMEFLLREELACRRLTMFDLTHVGLKLAGLEASFEPREIYEAGVRRGITESAGNAHPPADPEPDLSTSSVC